MPVPPARLFRPRRFARSEDLAGSVSWGTQRCGFGSQRDGLLFALSRGSSGGGSMSNKKSEPGILLLVIWNGITACRLRHSCSWSVR